MKPVMRKGFFRIIEVVIVAVLVFVTLTQLYAVPKANQPWSTTKLSVMSQDLLYSLEASSIDWYDQSEVEGKLSAVLPDNMGYAVSVQQDVRPQMRIGCACTVAQCATIGGILADFTLNGVARDFIVTQIDPAALDLSNTSVHYGNDAILLCASPSFTGAEITEAEGYLAGGKGIVQFSDLTQAQVDGQRWYEEVMNMRWESDSIITGTSARAFFPYMDPDERRYPVKKIFMGIPPALPSFGNFSNFGGQFETLYPADDASEKIVVYGSYYVGATLDGAPVPVSMIDWGVNGSGRVAWMSGAAISTGGTDDEISAGKLLKSLVVWAASVRPYPVVEGTVSTGATSSMRKVYGGSGGNMFEAVRVYLTVGYNI